MKAPLKMNSEKDLKNIQKDTGIGFKNSKLLQQVFIHRSYINEHGGPKLQSNERLEFLGDAVLEFLVTEYLYKNFKENEGELTNWRSAMVKGDNLSKLALKFNMDKFLLLSRGEEKNNGRHNPLLLANCFEAFVGAMYLDAGIEKTRDFIQKYVLSDLKEIREKSLHIDAKSHLQELSQAKDGITPEYRVEKEEGPDHAKSFVVAVYRNDKKLASGTGTSKHSAEIDAASKALNKFK